MKNAKRVLVVVSAVAAGAFIGYSIVAHRDQISESWVKLRDSMKTSKDRLNGMSEEVALRTAQITGNPKINQDWVDKQWESIGY